MKCNDETKASHVRHSPNLYKVETLYHDNDQLDSSQNQPATIITLNTDSPPGQLPGFSFTLESPWPSHRFYISIMALHESHSAVLLLTLSHCDPKNFGSDIIWTWELRISLNRAKQVKHVEDHV
jgi:hypothetical protein